MTATNQSLDPLTPPTCDLRAMPFMPLDVTRLLNSDFIAQTDCHAFKAGMTLMMTSWRVADLVRMVDAGAQAMAEQGRAA